MSDPFEFDEPEADATPAARSPRKRASRDGDDEQSYENHRAPQTNGIAKVSLLLGILSICGGVTGIAGLICGIIGVVRARTRGTGKGLAIAGILTSVFGILLSIGTFIGIIVYGIGATKDASLRLRSSNNLKQIGLGIQNFDSAQGSLPIGAIVGKDGKPLLSWRVAILPYIEEDNLYHAFKLDEPWDSPNNKPLIARMPRVYQSPGIPQTGDGKTIYKAFAGKGAIFQHSWDRPLGLRENYREHGNWSVASLTSSARGADNLILVAEAGDPVIWSKPDDMPYDPAKPLPNMNGPYKKGFLALMVDGRVTWFPNDTPQYDATLRAYIEPNSTSNLKIQEYGR